MAAEVRRARDDDLPGLVAAFGQAAYFARMLDRQRSGPVDLLLAMLDGRPVGDVALICEPAPEPELAAAMPHVPHISHLEVAESHRRQGIGSALLEAAEADAYRRGHAMVCLGVGVTNPARTLYDARGYDDWEHGTVVFRWSEPGPDGVLHDDSEVCHVLMKIVDPSVPGLRAWAAWQPAQAADRLAGCPVPWAVAGGWAIDLHLDRITREHSDLEIAIPRTDFDGYRSCLAGLELYQVGGGRLRRLGPSTPPDPDHHQVWVCEPQARAWRLDTFLEPGDRETWVSHRDERVTMAMTGAIRRTAAGIPYLCPEAVLFAKAKHSRDKDRADLDQTLPTLDTDARRWLREAIQLAHPGHPWLDLVVL